MDNREYLIEIINMFLTNVCRCVARKEESQAAKRAAKQQPGRQAGRQACRQLAKGQNKRSQGATRYRTGARRRRLLSNDRVAHFVNRDDQEES